MGSNLSASGQKRAVDAVPAEELLRLPVRLRGIDLGSAVDVILDPQARRVLGLEVLCRDNSHRFLPLTAADLRPDEIGVASALTLLAAGELAFYRKSGSMLRSLRGAPVRLQGAHVGRLADVTVSPNGAIAALTVRTADGLRNYMLEDGLRIDADPRRASAA